MILISQGSYWLNKVPREAGTFSRQPQRYPTLKGIIVMTYDQFIAVNSRQSTNASTCSGHLLTNNNCLKCQLKEFRGNKSSCFSKAKFYLRTIFLRKVVCSHQWDEFNHHIRRLGV